MPLDLLTAVASVQRAVSITAPTPPEVYTDLGLDEPLRDVCGRVRSPATLPGFRKGQKPGNAGTHRPADPPTDGEVQEIMDACPSTLHGLRNRALIALLRGSGLRIHEALLITPADLDFEHCTVVVKRGKGGKRRKSGINRGALLEVSVWLHVRAMADFTVEQPVFCVLQGATRGGRLGSPYVRTTLHGLAKQCGITRSIRPHQLRHAMALSMARSRAPLPVVSRQLGHSSVATTSTYLQGISDDEVFDFVAVMDWGS